MYPNRICWRKNPISPVSFFETIDELFLRVCGSCGELTKSARAIRKCYDLTQKYFAPLKNRSAVAMLLF
ncbi:hypothetical protein PF008_g6735 [Phytophthora fragariae]|uniref:Uncharacterized protein n=1 Tax=Phytophthora fragariae TaxID=53985 RepID=A0A6G0S6C6_9STRA|nr:hypothetical protein PF008_g6735 [Phytophthora fragariae]